MTQSDPTATNIDPKDFQVALEHYVEHCQKLVKENYKRLGYPQGTPRLEIDPKGRRYIRIVEVTIVCQTYRDPPVTTEARAVHSFIDKKNGDILKAAGWKAPAKHARGNILLGKLKGVSHYGPMYMRDLKEVGGP